MTRAESGKARIGIIGAGWWAVHVYVPVTQSNPDAELVAVSRRDREALARICDRFAIPHGHTDYRQMLERDALDGVIIASPHTAHFEHALAALEHGAHVLVDKPMTTDARQARKLVRRAEDLGREIIIPYGWNFKDFSRRAAALVRAGAIGRVEHVVLQMASALEDLMAGQPMAETSGHMFRPPPSTWADPANAGGYGWGQLSHALGLLFQITDLEPAEVYAICGRSPTGVDFYDAATVRFRSGATASLSGSSTVPKHRGYQLDLRLFGSEGMLLLDIERERMEVRRRDGRDTVVDITPGEGAYACIEPVHRLVDVCLGRAERNEAPGVVGQRAVEVLDAMYRSLNSGGPEPVLPDNGNAL